MQGHRIFFYDMLIMEERNLMRGFLLLLHSQDSIHKVVRQSHLLLHVLHVLKGV